MAGIALTALDDGLRGALKLRAAKVPEALKAEVSEVIDSSGLTEAQRKALAGLAPLILQEWGIQDQASPTAAAGVILAQAGFSWWRSAKALEAIAAKAA